MPKIPVNQLEALPQFTAAQFTDEATESGDITTIGNQLVRYFSAAKLFGQGVNFQNNPENPGTSLLLSNWLDLSGCNVFQLVIGRTCNNVAADSAEGLSVLVQYNFDGSLGTNPLGNAGQGSGWVETVAGTTFAGRGGPFPQTTIMTNGLGWANWLGTIAQTMCRVRLWLVRSIGPNAGQSYAIALWAQSATVGRSV